MLLVAAAALVSTGLLFWAVRDPIFAGTFLAGLIGVGGLLLLLRRAEPSGLAAPHEDAPYDAALLRAVLDGAGPTSALALTDPAGELISANSAWGRWFGAGVGPLASAKTARWIRSNVPGIHIPDAIIARLEGAQNQKREGRNICVEIMQECREIAGVSGVHVMAYRQEELVAEIVHESGVLAGRTPWRRDLLPGPMPHEEMVTAQ